VAVAKHVAANDGPNERRQTFVGSERC
jgi:hypothetical protein